MKVMTVSEAGRRGGQSRSERKLAAVRKNAILARQKLAEKRQKSAVSNQNATLLLR